LLATALTLSPSLTVAAQPPSLTEARRNFEAGESHFARGDYETALSLFQAARASSPSAAAAYNAGVCLERLQRWHEAAAAFEDAAQRSPEGERTPAEVALARVRARLGSTEAPPLSRVATAAVPAAPPTGVIESAPAGLPSVARQGDSNGDTFGPLGIAGLGLLAAATASGVVIFVAGRDNQSDYEREVMPVAPRMTDPARADDLADRGDVFDLLFKMSLAAGGIGLAAALVDVFVLGPGRAADTERARSLTFDGRGLKLRF
jgi:tetratricopeptide (TPR) repeat protein